MKKAFTLLAAVLLLFAVPFGALAAGEEKIVAKGIDVSYANYGNGKTVDFNKAKADGIRFVIIRAGYSGKGLSNTQKETLPDTHFELNCKNAAAAGLKIGVYYYSYAKTVPRPSGMLPTACVLLKTSSWNTLFITIWRTKSTKEA